MWYDLKFRTFPDKPIIFRDWQKKTVDFLDEHKNIKKVWLVNNVRKSGSTTFSKLLLYFRPKCDGSFFISNDLYWSKAMCKYIPIEFFTTELTNKEGQWRTISNFMTPVTLFGLEKEVEKLKGNNNLLNILTDKNLSQETELHLECIYENDFNVEKYKTLCSYDFDFFIINVSRKDLEKARPFIEADKDNEDVLIVEINECLDPEWWEKFKKEMNYESTYSQQET